MKNNLQIWAIGDIHGSYVPVENFWRRNRGKQKFSPDKDVLVCLGDFGGNFYLNKTDNNFKEKLERYDLTYFAIRGNHEARASVCAANNPDQWHIEEFFGNKVYVEDDFPYIKYALDKPALYQIKEYKTLVIPGAYSIDKNYRLEKGWPWFEDEQLSPEEMDTGRRIVEENKQVELVLSHTCPLIYEPRDLFLPFIKQSTVDKTMEMYLGEIEFKLDYKLWLWGHYHAYRTYFNNHGRKCIMLCHQNAININETVYSASKVIKTY